MLAGVDLLYSSFPDLDRNPRKFASGVAAELAGDRLGETESANES
jgi:hypothetical protein